MSSFFPYSSRGKLYIFFREKVNKNRMKFSRLSMHIDPNFISLLDQIEILSKLTNLSNIDILYIYSYYR